MYVPQKCHGKTESALCGTRIRKSDCNDDSEHREFARANCFVMCGLECTSTTATATTQTSFTSTITTATLSTASAKIKTVIEVQNQTVTVVEVQNKTVTVIELQNNTVHVKKVVESETRDNSFTAQISGGIAGFAALVGLAAFAAYKRHMRRVRLRVFDFQAEVQRLLEAGELEDEHAAQAIVPREIKRACVTMTARIGEGQFGEVWKGLLDESSAGGVPGYMVAIKTSKETKGEGANEMLREAAVMAQVSGHPNLVALVGVVTSGAPLLLLLSLCEHGSLLTFLKNCVADPSNLPLESDDRIRMGLDVAMGMEHLAARRFVHRDLAARNVLVDSQMVCKIADFGLSRGTMTRTSATDRDDGAEEEYYRSRTGTFPVRWTAPESMQTMRFAEPSDVWSFGILLNEIFTDGGKPYPGLSNAMVITKVQEGYRDPQPVGCPDPVYDAMLACWAEAPTDRPLFAELVAVFSDLLPNNDGDDDDDDDADGVGPIADTACAVANPTYATNDSAASTIANPTYIGPDVLGGSINNGGNVGVDKNLTVAKNRIVGPVAAVTSETEIDGGPNGSSAVLNWNAEPANTVEAVNSEYFSVVGAVHGATARGVEEGLEFKFDEAFESWEF